MALARMFKSLHGREFGFSQFGNLFGNDRELSPRCVDATITVGAEGASVANRREITIQLLDAYGRDVDEVTHVWAFVFVDAAGLAIATTGGSTGIAIGTDGAIIDTVTAKKVFILSSEADGDIDLTWTDTGTEAAYLGLRLPNGRMVFSSALTNAT